MIGQDMVNQLYDCQVVDPHGEKIGAVKRIWLDEVTGDPVWASVNMGMFGQKEIFIPLQRAQLHQDQLQVPVEKAQVKEAPRIEAEGDLMTPEEQQTLYQFYGMSPGAEDSLGEDMTIGDMSVRDMDLDDQGMQGGMGASGR
jgi:sporulation protein YlmC with PRC-barrel domain